jgi:hypothetical protein
MKPIVFVARGSMTNKSIDELTKEGYLVSEYITEKPILETESLRDCFAAKAMQGLYANHVWLKSLSDHYKPEAKTAQAAYHMADAMLAERSK